MAFDKIVGVDGTTYQFPTLVRTRISDNIKQVGSLENLAVIDAMAPGMLLKSNTNHNHTLASLSSNNLDELGDVVIGADGGAGIALADKHTIQYEASTSKWRNKVASGGVTVSDSRPTSPIPGDAWFDSNDGTLYVYYTDANTTQWVQVQANSALEGTILSRLGALEGRATALEAVPDYSPNYIINGAMDYWQRGTSFTLTNNVSAFTVDRWRVTSGHSAGTATLTQQTFTPGAAPVTGYEGKYFARFTAGSTPTWMEFMQPIEDVRTLAGQTVTVSFWARGSVSTNVTLLLRQIFGVGGSAAVDTSTSLSIGTSWTRYTYTTTMPSISGKTIGAADNSVWMYLYSASPAASQTFDIWGVQVEAGSVATPFRRAGLTLQGELAACQRYYHGNPRTEAVARTGGFSNAYFSSTAFPVPMRTTPTITFYTDADYAGTVGNVKAYWSSAGNNVAPTIWATSSVNINMYVSYPLTEFAQFSYTANAEL